MDTLDETRLLSAEGRMSFYDNGDEGLGLVIGEDDCEVGPAFSAASRDPDERRYVGVEDYFFSAYDDRRLFQIRIYVKDEWSGRQALLWETRDDMLDCRAMEHDDPLRFSLPQGSLRVHARRCRCMGPPFPGKACGRPFGSICAPRRATRGWRRWTSCGGRRGGMTVRRPRSLLSSSLKVLVKMMSPPLSKGYYSPRGHECARWRERGLEDSLDAYMPS
jgi:hypothetical protein